MAQVCQIEATYRTSLKVCVFSSVLEMTAMTLAVVDGPMTGDCV